MYDVLADALTKSDLLQECFVVTVTAHSHASEECNQSFFKKKINVCVFLINNKLLI